jgi:hypothetical protein
MAARCPKCDYHLEGSVCLACAADERDALRADVERLTQALRNWGHHKPGCRRPGFWVPDSQVPCTCGLNAALATEEQDPHSACPPNAPCGMEASDGKWHGKCLAPRGSR